MPHTTQILFSHTRTQTPCSSKVVTKSFGLDVLQGTQLLNKLKDSHAEFEDVDKTAQSIEKHLSSQLSKGYPVKGWIQKFISGQLLTTAGIHILPENVLVEDKKARCSSKGCKIGQLEDSKDATTAISCSSKGSGVDGHPEAYYYFYYSIGIDATKGVTWRTGDLLDRLVSATVGWSNFRVSANAYWGEGSTGEQPAVHTLDLTYDPAAQQESNPRATPFLDAAFLKRFDSDAHTKWSYPTPWVPGRLLAATTGDNEQKKAPVSETESQTQEEIRGMMIEDLLTEIFATRWTRSELDRYYDRVGWPLIRTTPGGRRLFHDLLPDKYESGVIKVARSSTEAAVAPVGQLHFSIKVCILNCGTLACGSQWRDDGVRNQTRDFYHGTSISAAKKILMGGLFSASGFRPSSEGMLGPGVYMSTDIGKARCYPLEVENRVILKLRVRCNTTIIIDRHGHPWQRRWQRREENGGPVFDAAVVPAYCGMVPSNRTETCVGDYKDILSAEVFEGGDLLGEIDSEGFFRGFLGSKIPSKVFWEDGKVVSEDGSGPSSAGCLAGCLIGIHRMSYPC